MRRRIKPISKLMSRRAFLKAAAVGTASVAGAGLLAPLGVVAEEAPAVQTSTDESGIRWDYEADVVVLGAGGRAALSGGNLHSGCGTEIQKKYGIEDSADQYYIDHTTPLTLESRYNDREYVRAVADYMAEAYEYILAKGVIIKNVEPMHQTDYTEGGSSPETVGRWTYCDQDAEDWVSYADGIAPSQGGIYREGIALTRPLERTFRKNGGQILLNYHMDKIFREGNLSGRVLGIEAHYTPTILPGETEPMKSLWSEGNIDSTEQTIPFSASATFTSEMSAARSRAMTRSSLTRAISTCWRRFGSFSGLNSMAC